MTETAPPPAARRDAPAEAPPAPPRRRVRRRRTSSRVAEWAAQAVLIMFGVVAGLALNEWREGVAEDARTARVLDALADEIGANRASVASATAYYGRMVLALQAAVEERGPDVALDLRDVEGYTGDVVPTLTAGTYDAATATGALLGLDIGLASTLSSTYASQRAFEDGYDGNSLTQYRSTPQVALWRAGSIYQGGQGLLERYDDALARLP